MATLVSTRRSRGKNKIRPIATSRPHLHPTLPIAIVKTPRLCSPRRIGRAHRLPAGFIRAITQAFTRPCRIWDRARNVRFVLEAFNQPESILPTKIREFLERFDALD